VTGQFQEHIVIDKESYGLCTEPLQTYLSLMKNPPEFDWVCTACYRGYIGHWTIKDNVLYLTDIQIADPTFSTFKNWRWLFDNKKGDIKAEWYSGVLRVTKGEVLEYVHAGYGSKYERDLFITIEKGIVIKEEEVQN